MHQYSNLNEGIYLVQSGYRNHTAIIECPYVSHKIEVYGAQ
jgi:exoribonuclease R